VSGDGGIAGAKDMRVEVVAVGTVGIKWCLTSFNNKLAVADSHVVWHFGSEAIEFEVLDPQHSLKALDSSQD